MKFVVLLIPLVSLYVQADDWLAEFDDGIVKVWSNKVVNSKFRKFKAIVEINASVTKIVYFMQNIAVIPRWQYRVIKAKTLKSINQNSTLIYNVINLPWPVKNRDSVMLITNEIVEDGIIIHLESQAQAYPKTDNIRIPRLKVIGKLVKLTCINHA